MQHTPLMTAARAKMMIRRYRHAALLLKSVTVLLPFPGGVIVGS